MKTYRLDLNSIEKVKGFVSAISNMEGYFDLVSGRYVVDAKSIMGIFSMDCQRMWSCEYWKRMKRYQKSKR